MDKAYYKLYTEYDKLLIEYNKTTNSDKQIELKKEINRIKEAVDKLSLSENDSTGFQAYPDYHNKLFSKIIYQKREFHSNQLFMDTTGIEDTCNSEFYIKAHQSFLKNFMTKESPYKSLLIYHGVGVGKTCTGVSIAENFRDSLSSKDKRIIILSSKNIQIGWKNTIYTPSKEINQCTGDTFINSGAKTDREVNKLVKQYYEIMAYQSFSNYVNRMIATHIQKFPNEEKETERIKCINKYFSNRLLIIDEVHNIRDEQGSPMRNTVKTIQEVIKYSDNLRLLLLTATPMYNRATEMIWILNMMLLNDKRPLIKNKVVLDSNGEFTEKGIQLIESKSRGYISYLRGENPITFPIRLYPSQLKTTTSSIYDKYNKNSIKSECFIKGKDKTAKPSKNMVGGTIQVKDQLQFLELFGSELKDLQLDVYNKSIQEIIDETPNLDIDVRGEMNPILDNIKLTQITDMIYPSEKDNLSTQIKDGSLSIDEFYGEKGLNNCMNRSGNKYSYKKKVLERYGPIFSRDTISKYSCKLASIINSIDKAEGVVFIYTNYIQSGIIPLQLLLEQNGYKKHTGEPSLTIPSNIKPEPISYNGIKKSSVSGKFEQAKYMVIDGSTSKKILQHQLGIINSKDNMNGEKIKIVLGTVVASEGLDFKRIRSVHILDPWPHLNRIEQTVGRAIRFCSHADLPDNQRNVLIYLHVSILSNNHETVDTSIYRYAEKKSMRIGIVENILKRNAIDRYLFRDVNVIRKGDIHMITMKPCISDSIIINVNPSDKSYSKVCSYLQDCDYNKDLESLDDSIELNDDTFVDIYSSTTINNLKKRIALLYRENYAYDLDSIVGLLNEYGYNQDLMIYLSINEMIIHKYRIHDKYGNSGYIITRANYYIFQPFLHEDETLPLYYRMNLLEIPKRSIILPGLVSDKVIEDVGKYSKSYEPEYINAVYDKLNGVGEEDGMLELYEESDEYPSVNTLLAFINKVYSDLTEEHIVVTGYLFDRLDFEDKCKLMYGYLNPTLNFEGHNMHDNLQLILQSLLIYKSSDNNEFYFNKEIKDKKEVFGFVLSHNDKPCFFEYDNNEIKLCNDIQLEYIKNSLKKFKKTQYYKQFINSTERWGYTTVKKIKGDKDIYNLKVVQPGNQGESGRYPPGPGNVCIGENLPAKIEKLTDIFTLDYPELLPILNKCVESGKFKKKDVCFLLEIAFRYNKDNSFYPYDKIWLKYI